jgi:hypothetical protein
MVSPGDPIIPSRALSRYIAGELGIDIAVAGTVHFDPIIRKVVLHKDLSLLDAHKSDVLSDVHDIADRLITEEVHIRYRAHGQETRRTDSRVDEIICGIWCPSWDECELKSPGYGCPYKNIK